MKKLFFLFLLGAGSLPVFAQTAVSSTATVPVAKPVPLDKSPMDIAYFPSNYPVLKIQDKATEPLVARVLYSRPQKEGRAIFGGLIEFNKVWRLGANEATEIEFFRDVKIKDKKLPKGRYTLYAIPSPEQWTLIFNKDTDIWGAFKYDEKKDVVRLTVPVQKNTVASDAFTINFIKTSAGADMQMLWDDVLVTLPIGLK